MKIKKIFISAVSVALMATSVFSVGAVEYKSTGSVYMGGYEIRGSVTAYPTTAQGYTYCAKKTAGKKANTTFAYRSSTSDAIMLCVSGTTDFVYNGQVDLSKRTPEPDASDFDYYVGAMNASEVIYPDQTHYHWCSEDSDNELRLGRYSR